MAREYRADRPPVLPGSAWDERSVPIDVGHQLLLYTDGISQVLADAEGDADARIVATIERDSEGGAPLLEAILAAVQHDLAGRDQPDDLTLMNREGARSRSVTLPGDPSEHQARADIIMAIRARAAGRAFSS